jgi:hypothetical protein
MPVFRITPLVALALSVGVHAGLVALGAVDARLPTAATVPEPLRISLAPAPVHTETSRVEAAARPRLEPIIATPIVEDQARAAAKERVSPAPEKTPATMPAPPAPTAEEWALASTYTLKNSKRYRYAWSQQVRSMMGTAVEGVQQGLVRFHIEIAPDGTLAKADVLWSTSEVAEKLALHAIRSLPPLPPTPTGKPLVFEKTIAFVPFETGWPPTYKYDCLPDPPSFRNAFAWDGSSPQRTAQTGRENATTSRDDRETECPLDVPDSIEAEEKDMERQFKEWAAARLNRVD